MNLLQVVLTLSLYMASSESPIQDTPPSEKKRAHHAMAGSRHNPNFPHLAEGTDVPESDKEHLDSAYMFFWRKLHAIPCQSSSPLRHQGCFTYILDSYYEAC